MAGRGCVPGVCVVCHEHNETDIAIIIVCNGVHVKTMCIG